MNPGARQTSHSGGQRAAPAAAAPCRRLWEYTWASPAAGKHRLLARAIDPLGRSQPLTRDPGRRNYMISHVVPVEVTVGG
jgi:hypothetical protein